MIVYAKTALKQLARLTPSVAAIICAKIVQYDEQPASLANQVKKLKGQPFLRLRVGDYRVIFTAEGVVLTIIKIGHRREIYD
ncbi:MAG: type II toxin-antitoxin system RelE/ParE family toxin [Alphaproteobacteria bacterium]|nr:type II toxin-antitoxin system RelE/ParE family toxin [Alphaproteobacteria bacterium]